MEFNDLLRMAGIAPETVAVMLHTPADPLLRQALLSLVDDAPDLFEVYQQNHQAGPEATLKRRKFAASFVCETGAEAKFIGLYQVMGWQHISHAALREIPARMALEARIPGSAFGEREDRDPAIFDLRSLEALAELRGRLVVVRTAGRSYMRLAENNKLDLIEIAREAAFTPPAPDWQAFVVTGPALRVLPKSWAARLQEWRGVYLIVDETTGARYVGAAYNQTNLLGRWRAHVARDVGVTAELAKLDPANFRFSILELLAPNVDPDVVIALENRWKHTLGTRRWGLNKN